MFGGIRCYTRCVMPTGEWRVEALAKSHLEAVAAVHCASFPGSMLTNFGPEAVRRYYLWQMGSSDELYTFGAFVETELAGFCFGGIVPTAISGFVRHNKWFLLSKVIRRPWLAANPLFRERFKTGLRVLARKQKPPAAPAAADVPKRPFDILSIAVHPRFQGTGVGRSIMAAAQDAALLNGFHVMTLMVHPSNDQALRFYERLGWERALMNGVWRGNMVNWLKRKTPVIVSSK